MRKINFILFTFCVCFSTLLFATSPSFDARGGIPYPYTPLEGSVEELYKDLLVTTIDPYISSEIEKQYGLPLLYGLYDVDFLEIDRASYRGFSFTLKIQVHPFVGAHNIIGVDEITLSISPYGTKVEAFKHIKTYPLPPEKEHAYPGLRIPSLS